MKKSDLVIGTEYFVNSRHTWDESPWGATRVRLVGTETAKWQFHAGKGEWTKTTRSFTPTGVQVEILHTDSGKVVGYGVVTLTSIRGEWAPTMAKVTERAELRRKHAQEAQERQLAMQLKTGQAVALATQMGVQGVKSDVYGRKVEVTPETMIMLLTTLDILGWTPEAVK